MERLETPCDLCDTVSLCAEPRRVGFGRNLMSSVTVYILLPNTVRCGRASSVGIV